MYFSLKNIAIISALLLVTGCGNVTNNYYNDPNRTDTTDTSISVSEKNEVDNNMEYQEDVMNDWSVSKKIKALLTYDGVSNEEFATFDECTRRILHNSNEKLFVQELYTSEKYSVKVYATPNTENLTKEEFKGYTVGCEELGSLSPLSLEVNDSTQLWFSQLGCGYEVGEFYGNETVESKACAEINKEVMQYRADNL